MMRLDGVGRQCSAHWLREARGTPRAARHGQVAIAGGPDASVATTAAPERLADLHHDDRTREPSPTGRSSIPISRPARERSRSENWDAAIKALDLALLRDPSNADIQTYIGYAHARLRQLGPAMGHYQRALMLNPRHRGVRTHLGELVSGCLDAPLKAQEQLAALKEICLIPCDEIAYLENAIGSRTPALTCGADFPSLRA